MNPHLYVDLLHNAMNKYADKACLHIKRDGLYQSWTFKEVHRDLNRCTRMLRKHGLKKGNNAVIIGENSPEWVIAFHSILLTGACTVPIDPNIPSSEIESIVETTEAKVIFCSRVYLGFFRLLKEKFRFIENIILLDPKAQEKEPRFDQYISGGHTDRDAFTLCEFTPDDPMVIIFTSGTTGRAKGVVLTQKNYTVVSRYGVPIMKIGPQDTVLAVLPLHHVFGFAACIAGPIIGGLDIVFVPYVKGPLILEALKDKGVTYMPAVPKMISLFYESVMHNVKKKGPLVSTLFSGMKTVSSTVGDALGNGFRRGLFSSVHAGFGGKLRLIISGGAALGKKYWVGFRQLGFTIVEGYGLTETFGPITLSPANDARLGSVGMVLPENEIKIDVPNDAGIGEVLLRGTCVFKGYYKNEEFTKQVFDNDGWFHTGDLGRIDKDGFLYISGRKKDMIVLDSGKNVYPDELEDYYSASPLIEEIGVFGVTQEDGEIVAAAIVPSKEIRKTNTVQQATDLIYEELIRLGKHIPVYRRISDFITVYQPLPRTTSRKLKKQEIRKIYNSIKRRSGSHPVPTEQLSVIEVALMETEEYMGIVSAITLLSPRTDPNIINPRSHLELDLGLDSLNRIELLSRLEKRFLITVPEDIFEKMETVGDLVSLVKDRRSGNTETSIEKIMDLKERIFADMMDCSQIKPQISIFEKAVFPVSKLTGAIINSKVTGLENLKDLTSPLIFASNYLHEFDPFRILQALPQILKNNTYVLGERSVLRAGPFPTLYRSNIIRLEKDGDPIEVLKACLSTIRCGHNLMLFPEGSINQLGRIGEFKSGVGLLAKETGATIVPIRIRLESKTLGRSSVAFGKPLTFEALAIAGMVTHDSPADVIADHIRTVINGM